MSEQKELTEQELSDLKKMFAEAKQKNAALSEEERDRAIIVDDHCCAGEDIGGFEELLSPEDSNDDLSQEEIPSMDENKWITVHPNGPNNEGRPALIDGESGKVKGGMGGKFTGKKISEAHTENPEIKNQKTEPNSPKLTQNEKSALSSYSGDDFLRINNSLRSGKISSDDQKQVERIDSAIQKSDLKPGAVLYRGLTKEAAKKLLGDQINKGAVFSDPSFISTSSDQWIANTLGGVKLKIEIGNNCKGLEMSKYSNNPQEKETLLPRNAKMQILGITAPKSPGQPVVVRVKYGD